MEKLTFQQIVEILEKNCELHEFGYDDVDFEEIGLGKVNEVDSYGGEDQGSEWYTVKHFVDHDVYVRLDGYYSSYEGTDFSGESYQEVFPTEVKRIEYLPLRK
jgi:hypothetical protein